ncbi:MAG: hypothetical protein ACYCXZ_06650 [Coriobacteriia bacterium]
MASSPSEVHFVDVETWATANGIGINATYEYLRREHDPLPHIRQGRRHLVDDELALGWLRRNFGVNTGEAA